MPILAPDGGHQLSPTSWLDSGLRDDSRRTCFEPNFGGSPLVKCSRGILIAVGMTVATDCPYQTKLAKEQYHVQTRENESKSTHATASTPRQGCDSTICHKREHAGGAGQRGSGSIPRREPKDSPLVRSGCGRSSISIYCVNRCCR